MTFVDRQTPMPQIEVIAEQEQPKGWQFHVQVLDDQGRLSKHTLTLSWADYNLWSPDGADEPANVAEAVMEFLLRNQPAAELGDRFDASISRRRSSEADAIIPSLIRR